MKIIKHTILLGLLIAALALNGCGTGESTGIEPIEPWIESSCTGNVASHYSALIPGFVRDFSIAAVPTTKNMSTGESDLEEAVSQAKAIGDYIHIILSVSFTDPAANLYDYRRLCNMAERADMGVSLALDIRALPNGATFADYSIRQNYKQEIENLIYEYPPDYLNLCMEMNAYALDDATTDDYPNLVSLYEEAYDMVESIYPGIVTYISHSWELDLLHAGIAPLQMFVDLGFRLDAAGISTFPQITGVENPSEIPGIYYADLPLYVDVPVIVECGFSDDEAYNSGETVAMDFPAELLRALDGLNLSLVQLVEMHDLPADGLDELLHHMGLRRLDGSAKPLYCAWEFIADAG